MMKIIFDIGSKEKNNDWFRRRTNVQANIFSDNTCLGQTRNKYETKTLIVFTSKAVYSDKSDISSGMI